MATKSKAKRAAVGKRFYVMFTERGSGDIQAREMVGPDANEVARRFVNLLNSEGFEHDSIQDMEFTVVPISDGRTYNLRVGFSLDVSEE